MYGIAMYMHLFGPDNLVLFIFTNILFVCDQDKSKIYKNEQNRIR